jgi:hypothetical protein
MNPCRNRYAPSRYFTKQISGTGLALLQTVWPSVKFKRIIDTAIGGLSALRRIPGVSGRLDCRSEIRRPGRSNLIAEHRRDPSWANLFKSLTPQPLKNRPEIEEGASFCKSSALFYFL